jgi:hypothetical protein
MKIHKHLCYSHNDETIIQNTSIIMWHLTEFHNHWTFYLEQSIVFFQSGLHLKLSELVSFPKRVSFQTDTQPHHTSHKNHMLSSWNIPSPGFPSTFFAGFPASGHTSNGGPCLGLWTSTHCAFQSLQLVTVFSSQACWSSGWELVTEGWKSGTKAWAKEQFHLSREENLSFI